MNTKRLDRSYLFWVWTLVLILVQMQSFAQDTIRLSDLQKLDRIKFDFSKFGYESPKNLSLEDFRASKEELNPAEEGKAGYEFWYEVVLKNDLADSQVVFFWNDYTLEKNSYYQFHKGSLINSHFGGDLTPKSDLSLLSYPQVIELKIPPNEEHFFIAKLSNLTNHKPNLFAEVINQKTFWAFMHYETSRWSLSVGLGLVFQGAVWIMMLYMLFLYFQNNRDNVYLLYALYLFFPMLYLALKLGTHGTFNWFLTDSPFFKLTLNEPLQFGIAIFYNIFAMKFLNVKIQKPWLYKFAFWLNVVYASYAIIVSTYFYFTGDIVTVRSFFAPTRLVILLVGLFFIFIIAFKLKGPLVRYFLVGSCFFFGGNLMAIIISISHIYFPNFPSFRPVGAINFTQMGIFLEVLFFSLGIGKLIQISNKEKEQINEAYILQLRENEGLARKINRDLEDLVEERTSEVIKANEELQESKAQQLKSEYEKQLVESEMNSLRLQMNPHFIFNSLNSIRYFILKQDSEKAANYITSFAKLLRLILHHSKQFQISLADEMEALELYMMFEAERFKERFEKEVRIAENIDPNSIFIQPLIIQPFVENAIWHGLMHKKEGGKLLIDISKKGDKLLKIIIEDNGIGRDKAKELKSKDHGGYKSYGLEITKERLEAMNKIGSGNAGFEMEDLRDENGYALGTRIILTINTKQNESFNNR